MIILFCLTGLYFASIFVAFTRQSVVFRWTQLHVSTPFIDQIKKVDVKIVKLENGGHYPVKQPALDQMQVAIVEFINKVTK